MSNSRQTAPAKHARVVPRVDVYWHAVTYRSVILYIALILTIVAATSYLIHPELYSGIEERLSKTFGATPDGALAPMTNQARFVNLDGKVEVKKVNSVNWESADYHTTLDKGDLVRTGGDGAARITFVDGTTYTVKNDSFVTVEQNTIDRDRTTSVAVHISSGAVDLATGSWESPRSKAEVSFANARASLQENSRAAVRSDPATDQNQITVSAGAANMQVGNQQVEIGKWERVTFANSGPVTKTMVLAPPDLAEPVNLRTADRTRSQARHRALRLVGGARRSQLRSARQHQLHVHANRGREKTVAGTSVDLTGLDPGDYFWSVTATDAHKRDSAPRDAFQVHAGGAGQGARRCCWRWTRTELHGNVVELIGRTEPGAALIINGEAVADIRPDGRFRYFTQALSRGQSRNRHYRTESPGRHGHRSACRLSFRRRWGSPRLRDGGAAAGNGPEQNN